jgi:hypothetical protein
MIRHLVLLIALLAFAPLATHADESGLALIYAANTWGEHSPCPS